MIDAMGSSSDRRRLVLAGIVLSALTLRPQIIAIGPLVDAIDRDLHVSHTVTGLLGTIPLLCMGKLPRPGKFLRFTFYSALAQSTGYFAFLVAADSSGVSVPAVLASQASVVGMVISFIVLGERLSQRQLAGIGALLTGVAVVAATR